MYSVYILLCDKAFFYTGVANDLSRRLNEHQSGYSPHTKRYNQVEFMYSEDHKTRESAENRERQIKGWSREKKKALISGDPNKLKLLSKSKS